MEFLMTLHVGVMDIFWKNTNGAFFSNAQLSFKEVLTAKHIVFYMEHPKCNQKSAIYTP